MLLAALFLDLLLVGAIEAAGEITLDVISVSDTHGWIYGHRHQTELGDYGTLVSYIDRTREEASKDSTRSVLAIDGGDLIEGTGLSDVTPIKGMYIYQAASEVGFDLITVGNHDLGAESSTHYIHTEIDNMFKGSYISTNTFMAEDKSPLVKNRYKHMTLDNNLKVLMFGFLYRSSYVASYVEQASKIIETPDIQEILDRHFDETDILVVANHMSYDDDELGNIVKAFRKYYDGRGYIDIPIILIAAHSHRLYTGTNNGICNQCFIVEAACYLEAIQHIKYTFIPMEYTDMKTNTKRIGYKMAPSPYVYKPTSNIPEKLAKRFNLSLDKFDTQRAIALRNKIQGWVSELNLGHVLGCSKYTYSKSVGMESPTSVFNIWLNAVLPAEIYNEDRLSKCVQFPVVGSSSIRDSIYKGEFVFDDSFNVMPFKNSLVYIENLTSTEISCAFSSLNKQYTEEEQRQDVYKRQAASSKIPRYVTPEDPSTLPTDNCYDLILTSYDADRFTKCFRKSGSCYEIIDPSKSYEATDYPTQPTPGVTTEKLLPDFFVRYMPCLTSQPIGSITDLDANSVRSTMRIVFFTLVSVALTAAIVALIGIIVSSCPKKS